LYIQSRKRANYRIARAGSWTRPSGWMCAENRVHRASLH
jgi:hypothetical protein